MDNLKNLLSSLNWWQKLIVILALAVIVYFTSGCSFKSLYHADNVTHQIQAVIEKK